MNIIIKTSIKHKENNLLDKFKAILLGSDFLTISRNLNGKRKVNLTIILKDEVNFSLGPHALFIEKKS